MMNNNKVGDWLNKIMEDIKRDNSLNVKNNSRTINKMEIKR